MIKTNVLMMGHFRELRETRRSQDNYKRRLEGPHREYESRNPTPILV